MPELGAFSRREFWEYCGFGETLGRKALVLNRWLVVRAGDRVLIPRARAEWFINHLGNDGDLRVAPPDELVAV
jgi:hypothetical protein